MVHGKCEECGKGRVPLFSVNHGKVTRLPGMHRVCMLGPQAYKVITGK